MSHEWPREDAHMQNKNTVWSLLFAVAFIWQLPDMDTAFKVTLAMACGACCFVAVCFSWVATVSKSRHPASLCRCQMFPRWRRRGLVAFVVLIALTLSCVSLVSSHQEDQDANIGEPPYGWVHCCRCRRRLKSSRQTVSSEKMRRHIRRKYSKQRMRVKARKAAAVRQAVLEKKRAEQKSASCLPPSAYLLISTLLIFLTIRCLFAMLSLAHIVVIPVVLSIVISMVAGVMAGAVLVCRDWPWDNPRSQAVVRSTIRGEAAAMCIALMFFFTAAGFGLVLQSVLVAFAIPVFLMTVGYAADRGVKVLSVALCVNAIAAALVTVRILPFFHVSHVYSFVWALSAAVAAAAKTADTIGRHAGADGDGTITHRLIRSGIIVLVIALLSFPAAHSVGLRSILEAATPIFTSAVTASRSTLGLLSQTVIHMPGVYTLLCVLAAAVLAMAKAASTCDEQVNPNNGSDDGEDSDYGRGGDQGHSAAGYIRGVAERLGGQMAALSTALAFFAFTLIPEHWFVPILVVGAMGVMLLIAVLRTFHIVEDLTTPVCTNSVTTFVVGVTILTLPVLHVPNMVALACALSAAMAVALMTVSGRDRNVAPGAEVAEAPCWFTNRLCLLALGLSVVIAVLVHLPCSPSLYAVAAAASLCVLYHWIAGHIRRRYSTSIGRPASKEDGRRSLRRRRCRRTTMTKKQRAYIARKKAEMRNAVLELQRACQEAPSNLDQDIFFLTSTSLIFSSFFCLFSTLSLAHIIPVPVSVSILLSLVAGVMISIHQIRRCWPWDSTRSIAIVRNTLRSETAVFSIALIHFIAADPGIVLQSVLVSCAMIAILMAVAYAAYCGIKVLSVPLCVNAIAAALVAVRITTLPTFHVSRVYIFVWMLSAAIAVAAKTADVMDRHAGVDLDGAVRRCLIRDGAVVLVMALVSFPTMHSVVLQSVLIGVALIAFLMVVSYGTCVNTRVLSSSIFTGSATTFLYTLSISFQPIIHMSGVYAILCSLAASVMAGVKAVDTYEYVGFSTNGVAVRGHIRNKIATVYLALLFLAAACNFDPVIRVVQVVCVVSAVILIKFLADIHEGKSIILPVYLNATAVFFAALSAITLVVLPVLHISYGYALVWTVSAAVVAAMKTAGICDAQLEQTDDRKDDHDEGKDDGDGDDDDDDVDHHDENKGTGGHHCAATEYGKGFVGQVFSVVTRVSGHGSAPLPIVGAMAIILLISVLRTFHIVEDFTAPVYTYTSPTTVFVVALDVLTQLVLHVPGIFAIRISGVFALCVPGVFALRVPGMFTLACALSAVIAEALMATRDRDRHVEHGADAAEKAGWLTNTHRSLAVGISVAIPALVLLPVRLTLYAAMAAIAVYVLYHWFTGRQSADAHGEQAFRAFLSLILRRGALPAIIVISAGGVIAAIVLIYTFNHSILALLTFICAIGIMAVAYMGATHPGLALMGNTSVEAAPQDIAVSAACASTGTGPQFTSDAAANSQEELFHSQNSSKSEPEPESDSESKSSSAAKPESETLNLIGAMGETTEDIFSLLARLSNLCPQLSDIVQDTAEAVEDAIQAGRTPEDVKQICAQVFVSELEKQESQTLNSSNSSPKGSGKRRKPSLVPGFTAGKLETVGRNTTNYLGLAMIATMARNLDIDARYSRLLRQTGVLETFHFYSATDIILAMMLAIASGHPTYVGVENAANMAHFLGFRFGMISPERLRQRLNELGKQGMSDVLKQVNVEMLCAFKPHLKLLAGKYVTMDADVTPTDNTHSHKEGVSLTYKLLMGYAPMLCYVGTHIINVDFRPGKSHSQCANTTAFLVQSIQYCKTVMACCGYDNVPLLVRMDSGNDSTDNFEAFAGISNVHFICSRNNHGKTASKFYKERMNAHDYTVLEDQKKSRRKSGCNKEKKTVIIGSYYDIPRKDAKKIRCVFKATWKELDRDGKPVPEKDQYELMQYWTSLSDEEESAEIIISYYCNHALCERHHSELKTDLDLDRVPSHYFATNTLITHIGMLTFNMIRLIGDEAMLHAALKKQGNKANNKGTCRATMNDEDIDFEGRIAKLLEEKLARGETYRTSEELTGNAFAGKVLLREPVEFLQISTVMDKLIGVPGCFYKAQGVQKFTVSVSTPWIEALDACWDKFANTNVPVKMEPDIAKDQTTYKVFPPYQDEEKDKSKRKRKKARKGIRIVVTKNGQTVTYTWSAGTTKRTRTINFTRETVEAADSSTGKGETKTTETYFIKLWLYKSPRIMGTRTTVKSADRDDPAPEEMIDAEIVEVLTCLRVLASLQEDSTANLLIIDEFVSMLKARMRSTEPSAAHESGSEPDGGPESADTAAQGRNHAPLSVKATPKHRTVTLTEEISDTEDTGSTSGTATTVTYILGSSKYGSNPTRFTGMRTTTAPGRLTEKEKLTDAEIADALCRAREVALSQGSDESWIRSIDEFNAELKARMSSAESDTELEDHAVPSSQHDVTGDDKPVDDMASNAQSDAAHTSDVVLEDHAAPSSQHDVTGDVEPVDDMASNTQSDVTDGGENKATATGTNASCYSFTEIEVSFTPKRRRITFTEEVMISEDSIQTSGTMAMVTNILKTSKYGNKPTNFTYVRDIVAPGRPPWRERMSHSDIKDVLYRAREAAVAQEADDTWIKAIDGYIADYIASFTYKL